MTTVTYKEAKMLIAFISEGMSVNGSMTADELIDDNMTYMTAKDLRKSLKWKKEVVAGVMGSLGDKGLINDTGETMVDGGSSTKEGFTDWVASNAGITLGFQLRNGEIEMPKPGKEVEAAPVATPAAAAPAADRKWVKTSSKTWQYGEVRVSFDKRTDPYVAKIDGEVIATEYWMKDLKAAVEAAVAEA